MRRRECMMIYHIPRMIGNHHTFLLPWIATLYSDYLRRKLRGIDDLHSEAFDMQTGLTTLQSEVMLFRGPILTLFRCLRFLARCDTPAGPENQLKDLRGTQIYEKCKKAFLAENRYHPWYTESLSQIVMGPPDLGGSTFGGSLGIHATRVIAYWSRILSQQKEIFPLPSGKKLWP